VPTPVLDALRPFVRIGARLYWRIRLEGVENIPSDGPLIIAPNHVTYADPVIVWIPVHLRVHFMAWGALFDVWGLSWLIRRLRAFPVQLDSADPRAIRETVRLLRARQTVMIFPEGGRAPDGRLQPFHQGAFRLACSLNVPVLPVTILGGHDAWPPGRTLPKPGRLSIVYHPAIPPPKGTDPRAGARILAQQVRDAIGSRLPNSQQPAADA
jgi:1-acyl-sn-glycerol-3-phosphate acyltransferase